MPRSPGDSDDNGKGNGIYAYTDAASVSIVTTDNGTISGTAEDGISVLVWGGDALGTGVADTYGNVEIYAGADIGEVGDEVDENGIVVLNAGGNGAYGSVTINGDANIYAYNDGISVWSDGLGAVTIDTTGDITSYGTTLGVSKHDFAGDHGVFAIIGNVANAEDINIKLTGDVSSYDDAIHACTYGTGDVHVNAYGSLSSAAGYSIYACSAGGGAHVYFTKDLKGGVKVVTDHSTGGEGWVKGGIQPGGPYASVTGDAYGIYVQAEGHIRIDVPGDISGDTGIIAEGGDAIDIEVGNVYADVGDAIHVSDFFQIDEYEYRCEASHKRRRGRLCCR